jgi:hypothetical protein
MAHLDNPTLDLQAAKQKSFVFPRRVWFTTRERLTQSPNSKANRAESIQAHFVESLSFLTPLSWMAPKKVWSSLMGCSSRRSVPRQAPMISSSAVRSQSLSKSSLSVGPRDATNYNIPLLHYTRTIRTCTTLHLHDSTLHILRYCTMLRYATPLHSTPLHSTKLNYTTPRDLRRLITRLITSAFKSG